MKYQLAIQWIIGDMEDVAVEVDITLVDQIIISLYSKL